MKPSRYFFVSTFLIAVVCSCASTNKTGKASNYPGPQYKVALIDLMLLKRQKLGAFQLTKDIGADGLEVDMGGMGPRETFDNQLANDTIRNQFLNKAKDLNLEICSLAMTGFFAQSFAERPTAV